MAAADRGPTEADEAASLEDAVDDGLGEVVVVQDLAPSLERLLGGEDHRALPKVSLVHDVEEHVRRVGAVGEVADLVDHEDVRVQVGRERLGQTALEAGA